LTASSVFAGEWRQFRGSDNTSVSQETGLPTSFDAAGGRNVAWKAPLLGRGPSSPIVVAGRVLVTCSSGPRQDRLHVLCFDAASGKPRWHRQLWATGSTAHNTFGAIASPTPASDGQRIFALYSSNDLACFDLEGKLQWFRGLSYESPSTRNDVGMSSSPLVVGRNVIVQLQNQGESFAAALDATTGETRWKIARERDAVWSSPTLLRGRTPGQDLVLLQDRKRLSAHEPETGKGVWQQEGWIETIASVTTCGSDIFLPAVGIRAFRAEPDGRQAKLLWYEQRLRVDNPSPVAHDGRVYCIKPPGILVCASAADGKILWQLRLKGPVWATPLLADGHLHVVNYDGLVQVVRPGREGELAGTGQLDSGILASPAAADGAIYFRSDANLWKISASYKAATAGRAEASSGRGFMTPGKEQQP
jgi:outer membrane protein assembly factor BamB